MYNNTIEIGFEHIFFENVLNYLTFTMVIFLIYLQELLTSLLLPDLILVIVAGNSRAEGLCVVIPTSIDPDHLSTNWSKRIWQNIIKIYYT